MPGNGVIVRELSVPYDAYRAALYICYDRDTLVEFGLQIAGDERLTLAERVKLLSIVDERLLGGF